MAYSLRKLTKDNEKKEELLMKFECKPQAPKMQVTELKLSLMNLSGVLVQLRFGNWDQSESHAVSIHKVFPDHMKLLPNEKKEFNVLVFGRRVGFHKLDSLKILNLANNILIRYERPEIQII